MSEYALRRFALLFHGSTGGVGRNGYDEHGHDYHRMSMVAEAAERVHQRMIDEQPRAEALRALIRVAEAIAHLNAAELAERIDYGGDEMAHALAPILLEVSGWPEQADPSPVSEPIKAKSRRAAIEAIISDTRPC
jgi:hypothetical protein